ncbi:hypothetical protein EBS80_00115 [bacterium]|nr:hypothetical protein [bacterium]
MTLDISLDAEAEEVDVVLNNQIVLRASKDSNGRVVFGRNFSRVEDDALADLIKHVCVKILALNEV